MDPDKHAPAVKGEPVPEIRSLDDLLSLRGEMDQRAAKLKRRGDAEQPEACVMPRRSFNAEDRISA